MFVDYLYCLSMSLLFLPLFNKIANGIGKVVFNNFATFWLKLFVLSLNEKQSCKFLPLWNESEHHDNNLWIWRTYQPFRPWILWNSYRIEVWFCWKFYPSLNWKYYNPLETKVFYLHIGMFMWVLISGHAYFDCRRRVKAIFKSR